MLILTRNRFKEFNIALGEMTRILSGSVQHQIEDYPEEKVMVMNVFKLFLCQKHIVILYAEKQMSTPRSVRDVRWRDKCSEYTQKCAIFFNDSLRNVLTDTIRKLIEHITNKTL